MSNSYPPGPPGSWGPPPGPANGPAWQPPAGPPWGAQPAPAAGQRPPWNAPAPAPWGAPAPGGPPAPWPGAPGPVPGPPPGAWGGNLGPWGGYGPSPFAPPPVKHTRHGRLLALLVVGLLVIGGGVAGASLLAKPTQKTYTCPPDCGTPPTAAPVSSSPVYISSDKSFSVHYDASDKAITSKTSSAGVTETLNVDDGGTVRLFGESASGRTAQQVASDIVKKSFPDAQLGYKVPKAIVGFQPGYGEVDNIYPQSSGGSATRQRLIIMVAVKNNEALVGEALGPYHPAAPGDENDDGHPTGASLEVAQLLDPLINSFTWSGDPPR